MRKGWHPNRLYERECCLSAYTGEGRGLESIRRQERPGRRGQMMRTHRQTRRNPAAQSYGTGTKPDSRSGTLCSPDCNWQNRGNPVTQRLDLPRRKLRNGSPPAGYFASEAVYAKKGKKRMRTMKKNGKRWLAMVLSLVMCSGLLQTTSFAANWSPGDKITINVRVYDESTGAVYNVGTDSVEKATRNSSSRSTIGFPC